MTRCIGPDCWNTPDGSARIHLPGCPEWLGLGAQQADTLCPAWPTEITQGPCILDREHPEPEHTNLDGYSWLSA